MDEQLMILLKKFRHRRKSISRVKIAMITRNHQFNVFGELFQ